MNVRIEFEPGENVGLQFVADLNFCLSFLRLKYGATIGPIVVETETIP